MARRKNNENDNTEINENNEEVAPVTEAQTENDPAAVKEAPAEIDLTGFTDAALSAVEERDTSTGELPETAISAVNEAYRATDGVRGKNQAKNWIDEQMKSAILAKDIQLARAYVSLKENLTAGSSATRERTPADPTVAFVNKLVSLRLAGEIVEASKPEGLADDADERVDNQLTELRSQVEEYRDFLESDDEDAEAPEVNSLVKAAFKLASGRTSGSGTRTVSYSGPRRDTEKHVLQVFESLEPGTFLSINDIAKAHSSEYGDDRPSAGAISQRLFPKNKEPFSTGGVQAVADEGKARGAVKL